MCIFLGKCLAEAELLLCTASAHPCMWAACSLPEKFAELGRLN